MKKAFAITLAVLALFLFTYSVRPLLPLPYLMKAEVLNGYSSDAVHGLNCADFVSKAHSETYIGPDEFFAVPPSMTLTQDIDFADLKESTLRPGDVGAFHGAHVAIYLGSGTWIDSDLRRGHVAKYKLSEKQNDEWFVGRVHILRWKR